MKSTTCSMAIPSAPSHPKDSAVPRLQAAPVSSQRAHNCRKNAVAPIASRSRPAFCFRSNRASMTATIVASTAAIPCGQLQTTNSGPGQHDRFGGYHPFTGECRLRPARRAMEAGQPLLGIFLILRYHLQKARFATTVCGTISSWSGQNLKRRNLEMTFAAPQLFSARLHRLRWALYVVLALVGGSVTFLGEHAQQRAS